MTKHIRKHRYTKKKYSVHRCCKKNGGAVKPSKRSKTKTARRRIVKMGMKMKISTRTRYNKIIKNGGDCRPRPDKSIPETPGYRYLQQLIHTPKIPNSVYMCVGHGCDIEEVLTVPQKCNYITRTVCGITANDNNELIFDFLNNALDVANLNPYENYTIEDNSSNDELVNVVMYEFRSHAAGTPYVNNKNTPFLRLGVPSGLRRLGNPHTTGHLLDGTFNPGDRKVTDHPISQLDWYLLHFKESLFPTQEQVDTYLQTQGEYYERIKTNFKYSKKCTAFNAEFLRMVKIFGIDYACIMAVFPGTHINYGCRGICKQGSDTDGIHPFVAAQRTRFGNPPVLLSKQFIEESPVFQDSNGALTADIKRLIEENKLPVDVAGE